MSKLNATLQGPVCSRCFEGGHETKDCKEEQDNFDLIGPIAAFIGARLQYPNPAINGQGNPWTSTISVDQHKEKFWYVRVYCTLADPDLVHQKWAWLQDRQRRIDAGERIYTRGVGCLKMLVVGGDEPIPEFSARCMLHDAIHYRRVYTDMVSLRPHLRERICDQADYGVLLHKTFDEVVIKPDWEEGYTKKFSVRDRDELVKFLKKVYDPSFRDRAALLD